jgi:hypothetical protein
MKQLTSAIAILVFLITASVTHALTVGQVDTFEDGTTQNWVINLLGLGSPPPESLPVNVPTGGPAGLDDNFLRLTSLGTGGPGGRLTAINFMSQWMGDYLAAGISGITMDVNNLGTTDLALRLLFENPQVGPPTDVAISQNPIIVPAGSGWISVLFPIKVSDLLALDGTVQNALGGATAIRIFHGIDPVFPGPDVVAQLGVDNIQAVPEPGAPLWLLAIGVTAIGLAKSGGLRRVRGK